MKFLLGEDSLSKLLRLLALGNFALGLIMLSFPENTLEFLSISPGQGTLSILFLAIFAFAFGVGYLIASVDTARHYAVVATGAIFRLFFFVLLVVGFAGGVIALKGFVLLSVFLWIGLIVFFNVLVDAYNQNTREESPPKKFHDLINYVRSNQGETLLEISEKNDVLLIFIRHFGCTFCRETVSEIAKLDSSIQGRKLVPVFVHMSDPSHADEFFSHYYDHPVLHISDPARVLYKSFGLVRGSLMQLFGPKVLVRGFWAGFFKGHGLGTIEGDVLQLGGYFVLSKGQVVFEHKTRGAADVFNFELFPQK